MRVSFEITAAEIGELVMLLISEYDEPAGTIGGGSAYGRLEREVARRKADGTFDEWKARIQAQAG